jgi:gluconokinase
MEGSAGFDRLMEDAEVVPPGAEGVLLLPYFTGERNPHWDSSARACLTGLSLEHDRRHVARAVLEAVAFCLADVWEAVHNPGELDEVVRLTGGITQSPLWAQIVADVLGQRLVSVEAADASAIGAAMLGFSVLGGFSLQGMAAQVRKGSSYMPDLERHAFYAARHKVFQGLYPRRLVTAEER